MSKLSKPEYTQVIPDLIKRLDDNYRQMIQWEKHRQWKPASLEYYYKTLAILELLETIHVFNVGFGKYMDKDCHSNFDKRVASFLGE